MKAAMTLALCASLCFCAIGIAATFEPCDHATLWRALYSAAALGLLAGLRLAWRERRN